MTRTTAQPVPVWVPDECDPEGLEGTWMLVDPEAPETDPRLAAQAAAVAELWGRELVA